MSTPTLYKPWVNHAGQPSAVADLNGTLVAKADYDALRTELANANEALGKANSALAGSMRETEAAAAELAAVRAKDEKIKAAADASA